MFRLPELAGLGVEREAVWVAVAVAPDFRSNTRTSNEWIVGGDSSVVVQTNDFASVRPELLCEVGNVAFAECDVEVPVAQGERGAEVVRGLQGGVSGEESLSVRERRVAQSCAFDDSCFTAVALLLVGEVDQPVAREVRMRFDIEQATVDGVEDCGHAANARHGPGVWIECPQRPGSIGDQCAPVGQERHAEWNTDAGGDDLDTVASELAVEVPMGADGVGRCLRACYRGKRA